ncbi:C2H2 finger domain-containing protein [Colletotrichum truncatum]|uniref:C2H2 finger domain-containing protein n=1 Tax=Colletotrichum truncatum TaxID=5467 RepID=A0ACC3ZAA6_COLTU|nr:C2H2 finger domain-containing protein [Colletotrichum truncatum]KAF6796169.1 C2H2 finger domain-containing protein [Colletotrichum truncatum]
MPPAISPDSAAKAGPSRGQSKPLVARQGTLDKFFSRSGASFPPASSSSAIIKKTSPAQPEPRSTFAVVIKSSPNKRLEPTPMRTVEDDADDLVTSDLSPQFRRLAAQAALSVSLSKPALPAAANTDDAEATSSGQTPQPQPKRRGRPKAAVTKDSEDRAAATGARTLRPDRPKVGSMYAGKRRGRPPKAPSPKPRAIYEGLDPHFNVFICEWEGCRAELHNFATLQKHVVVVHTRKPPFQCRWAKCAAQQPPREFSTSADLKSHTEDLHMPPIAWQVGDGPQVSLKRYAPDDGAELPDYLFDKAGNQITPSIRDQKEEDFLTWRNNRRKLKDLLLLRDQNMASEGEEEEGNGVEELPEGG